MQLSQRVRARDVEDFMSSVGKVRDVKLIVCNKTRRFKGIAYVEFKDLESVPLALGLSGKIFLDFLRFYHNRIECTSLFFKNTPYLTVYYTIYKTVQTCLTYKFAIFRSEASRCPNRCAAESG